MVTRRTWLKRGAAVVIGGATVIVGEPVKAAPVVGPVAYEMLGHWFREDGRHANLIAKLSFAADGSFLIIPWRLGHGDEPDTYGAPIESRPNATARDLIEALTR